MKKVELLQHNKETYRKIKRAWKTSDKTAVIQPTGTGKSYIIAKVVEDNRDKEILILSPSTLINKQFIKIFGKKLDNVEFMTYPKLMGHEEELNKDIIILDEFHRCGAEKWGLGVDRLIEMNSGAKILGTSATPIRFLDNERDMGDELFEGNIANTIRLSEAIARGILPMPLYVTALYTLQEEFSKLSDKIDGSKNTDEEKEEYRKELDKARNNLDKAFGIPRILKKYVDFDSGKMIVFCKNKEHQNEMVKVVGEWFRIAGKETVSYVIHSNNGSTVNEEEIKEFKEDNGTGIKLLFTIDMFNEGLHLDNIDGVILLRPTTSPTIFYQQIGRAIDAGSKTHPLILDLVANVDNLYYGDFRKELESTVEEIKKGKYKNEVIDIDLKFFLRDETKDVLETFNRMEYKLIDRFDYMFNLLCEYKEENGNCDINTKYIYKGEKLGSWVKNIRSYRKEGTLSKEREKRLTKIGFVWCGLKAFEEDFKLICEYKEENGNCDIPNSCVYRGNNLGLKVSHLRHMKKNGALAENKIELLNSIGFIWDKLDKNWYDNYNLLKKYVEKNGNCDIETKEIYEGVKLGYWVNGLRKQKDSLSEDKIAKLNDIGFIWEKANRRWIGTYNLVKEFIEVNNIHKYSEIGFDTKYKGTCVLKWLYAQNKTRKNEKWKLELLEQLNLELDIRKEYDWDEMVVRYIDSERNRGKIKIDTKISKWALRQRKAYKEGKLEKYKIDKLNSIGFPWEV